MGEAGAQRGEAWGEGGKAVLTPGENRPKGGKARVKQGERSCQASVKQGENSGQAIVKQAPEMVSQFLHLSTGLFFVGPVFNEIAPSYPFIILKRRKRRRDAHGKWPHGKWREQGQESPSLEL